MSVKTNDRSKEKGWTRERIMSVAASLFVILVLVIVSYHIGDFVPVATATTPNPVNANVAAPTPAPPVTAAPPVLTPLPPEISVAPLKGYKWRVLQAGRFLRQGNGG